MTRRTRRECDDISDLMPGDVVVEASTPFSPAIVERPELTPATEQTKTVTITDPDELARGAQVGDLVTERVDAVNVDGDGTYDGTVVKVVREVPAGPAPGTVGTATPSPEGAMTPALERMVYEWRWIQPGMTALEIMTKLLDAAINVDEVARAAHADDLAHGRAAVAWSDMDDDAHAWYMDNARAVRSAILGGDAQ